MPMLACHACGNYRKWRNAVTGPEGTQATCGNCGVEAADAAVTSAITVRVAHTDDTTFGSAMREINDWPDAWRIGYE